ncbi:MAG: GNAT family N-acetyltransferase [Lachnospiraceae bacterium]|nr:GNAT family N-acetyltransferase [Lachnospiraceae bacterium]
MSETFSVRFLSKTEYSAAMDLCWRVFSDSEAEITGSEGRESFRRFITDDTLHTIFLNGGFPMIAAYDGNGMIGVAALRYGPHLSLLFVETAYQHRGVGSAMLDYLREWLLDVPGRFGGSRLTVNASTTGTGFYHRLGFKDTGERKYKDGIFSTPMELELQEKGFYDNKSGDPESVG